MYLHLENLPELLVVILCPRHIAKSSCIFSKAFNFWKKVHFSYMFAAFSLKLFVFLKLFPISTSFLLMDTSKVTI